MNTFLKTHRLALTPLSPIHIGCGEDFEPTNYVIEDGVLYGFDPSRAQLGDAQRARLAAAANRASLLEIQRFFRENASTFKAQADVMMPVSPGVAAKYENDVGRPVNVEANGNRVFNQFFIERGSYTGPLGQPYIPGSSFKGAIRTAWLDALNGGRQPSDVQFSHRGEARSTSAMERRLLNGDFQTSPLRLLKIADLMPAPQREPARRVLYAVNLKKKQVFRDGRELQPKGIAARKEVIEHGQYRAFLADAVVPSLDPHTDPKKTPAPELRVADLREIARRSNAYNQVRLQRELTVLDGRGMVHPGWLQSLGQLLAGDLGRKLASGDAFLIRLGRYGGADSKTLSGEGVARIKIMGAKGQPPTFESLTRTVWLAADRENDQKGLLPFGWAVVEIDPQGDLPSLKSWCEAQSAQRPDMRALRQQFEAERTAAQARKTEAAAQAAALEAARLAQQLAAEQRAQAMSQLSAPLRAVEALRQQCEDLDARIAESGGRFKKQKADASQVGLYQDATRLVQSALADHEWTVAEKTALADMLEQWLPKVVTPWEPRDQRKKLKFAALRGQA